MTTRHELDELAQMCFECADSDDASIDDHLEDCAVCKDYSNKAEMFNQTLEVLQMMAARPEEERSRILGARMEKFTTMPAEERIRAIGGMLEALGELPEEDRNKIVRTRINILTSYPKEKRQMLMGSLQEIFSHWPEDRKMMEQKAVMHATQDYFILKRMMIRNMFKKMMT